MPLKRDPNLADPDGLYTAIIDAHADLSEAEAWRSMRALAAARQPHRRSGRAGRGAPATARSAANERAPPQQPSSRSRLLPVLSLARRDGPRHSAGSTSHHGDGVRLHGIARVSSRSSAIYRTTGPRWLCASASSRRGCGRRWHPGVLRRLHGHGRALSPKAQ